MTSQAVHQCPASAATRGNGARTSHGSSLTRTVTQQLLSAFCVILVLDVLRHQGADARSVRRLCKNEIDVLADDGVYIEPYEKSHVVLPLADHNRGKHRYSNENDISFDFRTRYGNGLLFYGRREAVDVNDTEAAERELLALRLSGGNLYYNIHCSNMAADVMVPHSHRLNDNQWHSVMVRFRRSGQKMWTQLEVDDNLDSKTYEVGCGQLTWLIFGGIRHQDRHIINRHMGGYNHYEGCLRKVNMPYALSSPPKYYAISICDPDRN